MTALPFDRPMNRYERLAWVFGLMIVVGSVVAIVVPAGIHWDFGNFYDAGRRVLAGDLENLYRPHTPINGAPPQATTGFWGTPLTAYLNVPIALLAPKWGLMLFKLETAIFNIAALVLLYLDNVKFADDTPATKGRFAAQFAFVSLLYQPIWTAFRTGGQTTPLVFFLLVVSLLAVTRDRPVWSAACFSLAVMIKPALITAIAFFVLLAGFRYLKYTASVFLVTGAMSVLLLGWPVHQEFLTLMVKGLGGSVSWFYNSGLYTTFENLKLYAPPDSWFKVHENLLGIMRTGLKLGVLATIGYCVYQSRSRQWSSAARNHFNFLMAICFFSLLGHIVYEAYLTFLFIVIAYFLAMSHRFGRGAKRLVGAMIFLSFWQNIIWVDLLRGLIQLNTIPELIAIGLVKSGPVILLLVFLWRHWREWLDTYDGPVWKSAAASEAVSVRCAAATAASAS